MHTYLSNTYWPSSKTFLSIVSFDSYDTSFNINASDWDVPIWWVHLFKTDAFLGRGNRRVFYLDVVICLPIPVAPKFSPSINIETKCNLTKILYGHELPTTFFSKCCSALNQMASRYIPSGNRGPFVAPQKALVYSQQASTAARLFGVRQRLLS